MWFVEKFARFSCFSGTFLFGLVLFLKIVIKSKNHFGFTEESLQIGDANAFKVTPDMIKWICQQFVDFCFYFGIVFMFYENPIYKDLVIQCVLMFVIRIWILFLIWTYKTVEVEGIRSNDIKTKILVKLEEGHGEKIYLLK
uniref:Uncharacterized protein n=1 Tax=Megaselia scalaris TaxID=36166 RepID=T1GVA4_MEGSC